MQKLFRNCNIKQVLLLAISTIPIFGMTDRCNNTEILGLCINQDNCDECMMADPCCHWCFNESYSGRKCNVLNILEENGCGTDKIEMNHEANVTISENEEFSAANEKSMDSLIQMRPQKFEVVLRKDKPVNISFTYKPVANYPLELYFLGDLSYSMFTSLQYMKNLGRELPDTLMNLTNTFRIAYGSFLDKTGMPFYFMDPKTFNNPCLPFDKNSSCEKGYLFRHRLNFTHDTVNFSREINESQVSANVDDLDGALDAILQILVCGSKIGWTENSRKIILLPTDSLLHTAGDGLLLGAVLRPTDKCLLDDKGVHSQPLRYDYPSLEQIVSLLRQKKVNIIFAVSRTKKAYYDEMNKNLIKDYGYVGELEENSENILDLIKKGYQNFAEQVSFYFNSTLYKHLNVKFYADCDNTGTFNETSTCYGVESKPIKFIAEVELNSDIDMKNQLVYIEEKNIDEKIEISISYYLGKCKCSGFHIGLTCDHGKERCGQCYCEPNWTGTNCSENCENTHVDSCRKHDNDGFSRICNHNGYCSCGKCKCDIPYTGDYCEFKCPFENGKICNGPVHGKCFQGSCTCEAGYKGETCSCSNSTENCYFDDEICSGHGKCPCDRCECDQDYSGKFCELYKSNNTICDEYTKYIQDHEKNATDRIKAEGGYDIQVDLKTTSDNFKGPTCEIVSFQENRRCFYKFTYYKEDKTIHLPTVKSCTTTAGFVSTIGGLIAAAAVILAGIAGILIHKYRIHKLNKLEYKRFIEAKDNYSEMNPLYISPVSTYENPTNRLRRKNNTDI